MPSLPCLDGRFTRRVAVAGLAAAVLMTATGCGTRATDAEIIEAVHGPVTDPVSVASTTQSAQSAASVGTPVIAANPGAPAAPTVTGSSTAAGTAHTTASSAPTAATVTGTTPSVANHGSAPVVATKSTVTIGTLGPFSGALGAVTQYGPTTLRAWAAYTNAHGGLNGHPIKVVVGDDQGDPATGLTLAKRMVESDHIIAVVAPLIVFGYSQIDTYLQSKQIPIIGNLYADFAELKSTINFPVTAHIGVQLVKGMKTYIDNGSAARIAILYCVEVSAVCSAMADYAKKSEVGDKIVEMYPVSLVAPTYTSQCLRMAQQKIDFVYLMMDSVSAARAIQNCATQGFKPRTMLLSVDATPDVPGNPTFKDTLLPGPTVAPGAQGIGQIDLLRQVMATYAHGVGLGGVTALAWAAAQMFALVSRNLPDQPTSIDLLNALWKVKNQTLDGLITSVTYVRNQPAKVAPCIFLWGMKDGAFVAPVGVKPLC